jgi:hypothetical protein
MPNVAALRAYLDSNSSTRLLELFWHEGRLTLVLVDPGGVPLERVLARPMEVTELLRVALPLAAQPAARTGGQSTRTSSLPTSRRP